MAIPKIIHYCWFGKTDIPNELKQCMNSWNILKEAGYEIKLWNEENCSCNENDFVRYCFNKKKWGFIGDYYRTKVLYEYGGIYLDTDVIVKKPFDDLLDNKSFMGFSCDCAICTAVIGSEKGSSFFKGILDMYDNGKYYTEASFLGKSSAEDEYGKGNWAPSNEFWTWYLICTHKNFKLNNKTQKFDDITIYPKSYFELGSIFNSFYCIHTNYNSWREHQSKNFLRKIKKFFEKNQKIWIIIRTILSNYGQRRTSFYKYMEK